MESRNTRPSPNHQSSSLLSLSRDLIFWQGEAQRQRELGERHGALHALALHVLGGRPKEWADAMAKAVPDLISQLGADCWYAGILGLAGPPDVIISSVPRTAPASADISCLEPDVIASLAARLRAGDAPASARGGRVGGALWLPVEVAGIAGFSGCHAIGREIVASEPVRALLHGLGGIALAAHLRSSGDRAPTRTEER